jgi:hypothetical protein
MVGQRLDPAREGQEVVVRFQGIRLKELLAETGIEGLSGTGRLSGRVPVRLSGGRPRVDTARLAAEGDGVLRYRSRAAERALGQAGEQVRLMLKALRDFRYRRLELRLERDDAGEAALRIETEGHNPDVLDGYPFRFNIRLTGDLGPILEAVGEGRRLKEEVLRRSLEMRGAP